MELYNIAMFVPSVVIFAGLMWVGYTDWKDRHVDD